ncbi:MAG: hypothetical protein M3Y67_04035 [Pseudomonadota bacterium]|nr:hypothetical protein [Pseudomonadota bacterium]
MNSAAIREAARSVEVCMAQPPDPAKQSFHWAMRHVIQVRNGLLTQQAAPDPGQLDRINAVLSLMSSIEFPLAGFHSGRLEHVIRALQQLVDTPDTQLR